MIVVDIVATGTTFCIVSYEGRRYTVATADLAFFPGAGSAYVHKDHLKRI
jgi:hypothetical protein